MSGFRILASLTGIAVVFKLIDENRRLRMELNERIARDIIFDTVMLRYLEAEAGARDFGVPRKAPRDEVEEAAIDSFPASDPPSFNAGR